MGLRKEGKGSLGGSTVLKLWNLKHQVPDGIPGIINPSDVLVLSLPLSSSLVSE